jgi:hypothetical protein
MKIFLLLTVISLAMCDVTLNATEYLGKDGVADQQRAELLARQKRITYIRKCEAVERKIRKAWDSNDQRAAVDVLSENKDLILDVDPDCAYLLNSDFIRLMLRAAARFGMHDYINKVVRYLDEQKIYRHFDYTSVAYDAAKNGALDIVKLLRPKLTGSYGERESIPMILQGAAEMGDIGIVTYLLDYEKEKSGASVLLINAPSSSERNEIIFRMAGISGSVDFVTLLLRRLNEFYVQDQKRITKAIYSRAAMRGHLNLMAYMGSQSYVPAPDMRDENEAFYWAAEYGHLNVLRYLAKNEGVNISQYTVNEALKAATEYGRLRYSVETIEFLINHKERIPKPDAKAIEYAIYEVDRAPQIVESVNLADRAQVLALLKGEPFEKRSSWLTPSTLAGVTLRSRASADENARMRAEKLERQSAAQRESLRVEEEMRQREFVQNSINVEETESSEAKRSAPESLAADANRSDKAFRRYELFQSNIEGALIPEKLRTIIDKNVKDEGDDDGTKTEAIHRFKTTLPEGGKRSYIIKEHHHGSHVLSGGGEPDYSGEFGREQELVDTGKVKEWKSLMRAYADARRAEGQNVVLPELTDYIATKVISENGESVPLALMERAYGKSMTKIAKDLENRNLSEAEAVDIARNIGSQMGAMTRAFFLMKGTFLHHGDFQDSNAMYSMKKKKFYWIDLGGTREISYTQGIDEYGNNKYLSYEADHFKTIWWMFHPFQRRGQLKDIAVEKDLGKRNAALESHRIGILAGNVLFDAYFDQVKDLPPRSNPDANNDDFTKKVTRWKRDYVNAVRDAFKGESEAVLTTLGLISPFT